MKLETRHREWIEEAAVNVIAVADSLCIDLVDVIAEMERYIIQETKVGDAEAVEIPAGRRGYTLRDGRLVTVT